MPRPDPIRLLVVCGSLGVGGAEMQAARMLPRIDRSLFRVEVVYYNHKYGPPRDELVRQGIPVTFLGKPAWDRGAYLRDALAYMRAGRFDLVHAWSASANHYGRIPALLSGVPVVVGGLLGQGGLDGIWPAVYSLMNLACAGWIVNSDALREFALSKLHLTRYSPIAVVPNGIDLELDRVELERARPFYLARKRARPVVGLVARLHPVKNHLMFLDVAARLRGQGVEADYWIIGDGPARDQIAQAIEARRLGDCVHLLGQRDDVAAAYEVMDVAVLTSDSEGCPNTLLEAMRAALPVVTTRCTSLDRVVVEGSNGFSAAVGAVDEFADKLSHLINNEELRIRFGEVSRQMVEKTFSMPVAVQRLERAYVEFLKQGTVRHTALRHKLAGLGVS